MSSDNTRPKLDSFLDQYAGHRDWQHVNLARPGASNFTIRLQIERAIADKPDYVIVGATSSDRIDLPVLTAERRLPINLANVDYQGYRATSEAHVDNRYVSIVSDTLNNIIDKEYAKLANSQRDTVRLYIRDIHNPDLADLRDRWIIRDGLKDLVTAQIPFLFMPGPLFYFDWTEFGSAVWQGPQAWDLIDGIDPMNLNHNTAQAHQQLFNSLVQQTQHWA